MRMIRKAALAALPFTMLAAGAMAADLPTKKPAPYIAPMPMFTWTGLYVGLQGGWAGGGAGRVGLFSAPAVVGNHANLGDLAGSGGFIGMRLGYNWQLPSNIVVGLAGDLNADWIKDSIAGVDAGTVYAGRSKINWDGSLRVNAGYAIDRVLLYVTGGVAFAHQKYTLNTTAPVVTALNTSRTHTGWTIGGGVQYAVTNNLIAGLEYRYSRFQRKTLFGATVPAGPGTTHTIATPEFHRIAATLDYKF